MFLIFACACAGMGRAAPGEEQLWGYLVQLTSALRAAHSAGLLLRPASLMPSKLLLTSPGRIRVGACIAACLCAATGHAQLLYVAQACWTSQGHCRVVRHRIDLQGEIVSDTRHMRSCIVSEALVATYHACHIAVRAAGFAFRRISVRIMGKHVKLLSGLVRQYRADRMRLLLKAAFSEDALCLPIQARWASRT